MATVLVAEDEERIRRVVQLQLEMEGYATDSAGSGEECREKVGTAPPDLLILDYLLPDSSGDEVVAALRRSPATRSLPVILLSGLDPEQIEPELLADERVHFLAKPFDNSALVALVKEALAG